MANYTKGTLVNVFYHDGTAWKAFAYSTNNSLSTSSETTDISSKDHGLHPDREVTATSFSMSGEYLFSAADANIILAMQQAGKEYSFCFAQTSQTNYADGLQSVTGVGEQQAWTPGTTFCKYGNGLVTSAEVGSSNGEVATVSLEITGSGALSDSAPTGAKLKSYPGE